MALVAHRVQKVLVERPASEPETGRETTGARPTTEWVPVPLTKKAMREHPWDAAHAAVKDPKSATESAVQAAYAEPDFVQSFVWTDESAARESFLLPDAKTCQFRGYSDVWPPASAPFAWHLDDDYSQLVSARKRAKNGDGVRIAILDTGFDPKHSTLPKNINFELQKNITGDGPDDDATDPAVDLPLVLDNPGHGVGTLAILAGNRYRFENPSTPFDDFLGGAPHADVVPVRIATSVIHFSTSAMAEGIDYAVEKGCQVVSISMGGVPARSWATAVNRAYENGVCIVAAAGNRIGPLPPANLVWPARFKRVIAACGATFDKTPYSIPGLHRHMHGCFGPKRAMKTAMAAYTPNIPWAKIQCGDLVTLDGAGTSSATPQVAAAAALLIQNHNGWPNDWRRVEAIRYALFSSADKSAADTERYFGNGLLRANDALDVQAPPQLQQTSRDDVRFPWLKLLFRRETTGIDPTMLMLEVEALQHFESSAALLEIAGGADPVEDDIDYLDKKRLLAAMSEEPGISKSLREFLNENLKHV